MQKNITRIAAVGLSAVMLAGCASSSAAASASSTTDSANEKVTITFGYWGDSGETEAYTKAIEGIENEIPNVEVKLQHYPGTKDFWDSLPGQIAAGTAPDIIAPTNENHLYYISEGLFLPMDEYGFDLTNTNSNAIDAWTYDGKLYGIPVSAAPGLFIINQDLWDAAGLTDYPTTWDEVYEDAKVLTQGDVKGLIIDFSGGYHPTQYVNSFGGGWKNGQDINSAANVQAMEYIPKMYKEGLAVNPKDVGLSWDGEVFAAGKGAMTTGGTWYIGMMKEAAPDTNYVILPMPGENGKNGCSLHSIALTVLNNTKNPEIAAKVAYYMSRTDAQKASAEIVGTMPADKTLSDWYFEQNPKMENAKVSLDWATSFGYPVDASDFQTDLVRGFEGIEYAGETTTAQEWLDSLSTTYKK